MKFSLELGALGLYLGVAPDASGDLCNKRRIFFWNNLDGIRPSEAQPPNKGCNVV